MEANPIIVKELRGRMRGARATITIVVHLLAISAIVLLTYQGLYASQSFGGTPSQVGRILYYIIMAVQLLTLSVISVTSTSGSISGERERQTYDVLLVTLLSPLSIVLGKLVSSLAYGFLLILAAIPLEVLAVMLGGIGLDEVLVGNLALLVMVIFYGCSGLYWSSLFRSSALSNGVGIGFVLFCSIIWPLLVTLMVNTLTAGRPGSSLGDTSTIIIWLLLSLSPPLAFAASILLFSSSSSEFSLFTTKLPGFNSGQGVPFLHPWVIFSLLALLLSLIFIRLSVRNLRPGAARLKPAKQVQASTQPVAAPLPNFAPPYPVQPGGPPANFAAPYSTQPGVPPANFAPPYPTQNVTPPPYAPPPPYSPPPPQE